MAVTPSFRLHLDPLHFSSSKFHCSHVDYGRHSSCFRMPYTFRIMSHEIHTQSKAKSPLIIVNCSGGNDGRGSTMQKIVEKLRGSEGIGRRVSEQGRVTNERNSLDILYEEGRLPTSMEQVSKDSPVKLETPLKNDGQVMFPWEKPREEPDVEKQWTARSKSRTFLAELTLPDSELKRLKNMAFQIKSKVRIKGSGVSEEVVRAIHERWSSSEIVRIKVDGALALNMKKVHETLEKRTGGLVIWRSGTSISLYRGVSYVQLEKKKDRKSERYNPRVAHSFDEDRESKLCSESYSAAEEIREKKMQHEINYEVEVDRLLDGLGPRYTDWSGCNPLPVDADMLPGIVPGFQPPLRVLPYGVRPTLSRKDTTFLQRLAKGLPPHFALGRSRQLQGLAVAMIKLWEKVSIAKIALKRGVQQTTSERMAEDLKNLTGGQLLSRTKDFLVFYRGKNFLMPEVSEVLVEREQLAKSFQDDEEQARSRASSFALPNVQVIDEPAIAGTLEETLNANMRWGKQVDDLHTEKIMREAAIARHNSIVHKLERKLDSAQRRLKKAGEALLNVETFLKPTETQADPDSITDEERFMFRKLGLRMKAFLLLGRRGIFGGTVENMHLHWKYRELVKIVLKAKSFEHVKKIALGLEAESGGVLVSVDKVSKGYAIIVYRGKDYQRPSTIRPKNLLTKRKALARSIEFQRREALTKHVSFLQSRIEKLNSEINNMNSVKDQGNHQLYDELDSAYNTEDDETEEKDGAYLETYVDDNDTDNSDINLCFDGEFPQRSDEIDFEVDEDGTEVEMFDYDEEFTLDERT